ncbi:SLC13 family permease [Thalassotalea ponticola]|uniref:SLC13 family permease n=1 Tax=Thalassotalea ponticola TaxID=1523392 RepID=UPI0025B4048B|nr:SLC13 family permease [Thalassotalea ponticola]MDN3652667.1 SLC13 family permease [Thalassotalea ponticola]
MDYVDQWLMAIIFGLTLIGLVRYQHAPERVFAAAALACLAFGLASTESLLTNATNPGLVTLLLLLVCSFAIDRTSLLRVICSKLIVPSKVATYSRLLLGTALSSALLNNTAVVATLITPIKNNSVINPSKLLLPLSYAAILGGTLTLVGTSTNLIVNSMVLEKGLPSLGFFDFTLVGAMACASCFVVVLLRLSVLPKHKVQDTTKPSYFIEAQVAPTSSLCGRTIVENNLRNLDSLYLLEIIRHGKLISPVRPNTLVQANDRLIFTGDVSKVKVLQQFDGLRLFAEQDDLLFDNLTEVLVKPGASIIGLSIKQSSFRARFDAGVVAIRREGGMLSGKLGDMVIKAGDFLVLAVGKDFAGRRNLSKNFFLLSGVTPENILLGWRNSYTVIGFVVTVAASVLLPITLLECLLYFVASLFAFGCLSVNEVKRRFPFGIWLIVSAALTLSNGLENSGLSTQLAHWVEHYVNDKSVMLAFVCVYLITLLLTEMVTNNAAAALIFPIAYNVAQGLGVDPMPFIMAVAFAASGSFILPYGYQTNLMVFNAGHYQLKEFLKMGIPVSLTYSAVVLYMIPVVFPF